MVIDNVDLSYCSRFEGNERGEAITFTVLTCSVASRKRTNTTGSLLLVLYVLVLEAVRSYRNEIKDFV